MPGVYAVQLCRLDQGVGDGGGSAAGLRPDEQIICPSDGYRSRGPLGRFVIQFEEAVVQIGPGASCGSGRIGSPRPVVTRPRCWAVGRAAKSLIRPLNLLGEIVMHASFRKSMDRITHTQKNGHSRIRPDQVWCVDITCIPMRRGFLYLVAIMDWFSRKVLSWRLSNTMEAGVCVEALKEALAKYGPPEIFNSDQGSQFTRTDFTDVLHNARVKISMDGRGRGIDNRMIERLWRSLKYECVYLNAFEAGSEARKGIGEWITYHTERRPHSSHGSLTPSKTYDSCTRNLKAAA